MRIRSEYPTYDQDTAVYFNNHKHEYAPERLSPFISAIQQYSGDAPSLIDIGCGVGNALESLKANSPLQKLCVIDVSERCVADAKQRLHCDALVGSILDVGLIKQMPKFDFALMAALLHHLVGKTRAESKAMAIQALSNALQLLKDGGYLLLAEPVFSPEWAMDVVFYIKTAVSALTSERIGLFGYGNNIGAPIVSYYDSDQLEQIIASAGGCEIVATTLYRQKPSRMMRMAGITDRSDATFTIKKAVSGAQQRATPLSYAV